MRPVRLVAPVVEGGDVPAASGPAARHEELGELVELEVGVQVGHGETRRVQLVTDEGRLGRDGLEAEGLRALD